MEPGATQLILMPNLPSSTAATRVNVSMPPLDAQESTRLGKGCLFAPEPMLMMQPPVFCMSRAACWVHRKVPFRLVRMVRFQF